MYDGLRVQEIRLVVAGILRYREVVAVAQARNLALFPLTLAYPSVLGSRYGQVRFGLFWD